MHLLSCIYVCAGMYVHVCVCVCMYVCACMHACMCACVCMYVCVCMHVCMCACVSVSSYFPHAQQHFYNKQCQHIASGANRVSRFDSGGLCLLAGTSGHCRIHT
jgi:hypothetical protein